VVYLDNDPVVLSHATALLADDKATFATAGDLGIRNSRRVRGLAASVPLSRSGLVQGLSGRLSFRHATVMFLHSP
jgi:S-adenosyl methyltransferase